MYEWNLYEYKKTIMELHEFITTKRSGHHAIINWIIRNLTGNQCDWKYKMNYMFDTGLFYLNEANLDLNFSYAYINDNLKKMKYLFAGYEDAHDLFTIFNDRLSYMGPLSLTRYSNVNMKSVNRIIIIRNFYDNLCSRLKNNIRLTQEGCKDKNQFMNVECEFISLWKRNANAIVKNKTDYIKFEDWLTNDIVRTEFMKRHFNLKDTLGINGVVGTGSSFGNSNDYVNRYDEKLIHEGLKDKIRKDNELHYLIGALGYKYISI